MDETWQNFRRSMIWRRMPNESFIPEIDERLLHTDACVLAHGYWQAGDRTTAGRLLAGELVKMGYGEIVRQKP